MCPICWATTLATFSGLLAISVITIAATDRCTITGALVLGTASILQIAGVVFLAWWVFAITAGILICRVAILVVRKRESLLLVRIWRHARNIAAKRCSYGAKDSAVIRTDRKFPVI